MEHTKKALNPIYILPAILILIVIFMAVSNALTPTVSVGDTIKVYYTGTFANGTVFDSNIGGPTLNFTVGSGQMIRGFDQGVIGMKLNEPKTIVIPANEAYGEINPALIVKVPLSQFGNQTVKAGMTVSQVSGGQSVMGTITAVNSTDATIDFNPRLAGQTLIFNITVVNITKG